MALEGLQLGQYRLLRLLGSGGMGEVYLAEDARINQQVAIKVSRTEALTYPNSSTTQDAIRLFQREAKAIARLDHPYILSLFSYGEENVNGTTFIYIVMPYRHEGSFANWLQERNDQKCFQCRTLPIFSVRRLVPFNMLTITRLFIKMSNLQTSLFVQTKNFLGFLISSLLILV